MRILDPCCSSRMWWFDRSNPEAVYGDKRKESHTLCDGRTLVIDPDLLLDFRALPFAENTFDLVAFDPPHLRHVGESSWTHAKYGRLGHNWKSDLSAGFSECFRVLKENGTLVFKWNEYQIPQAEVLPLALPYAPLFGSTYARNSNTHWYVFAKSAPNPACSRPAQLLQLGFDLEYSQSLQVAGG